MPVEMIIARNEVIEPLIEIPPPAILSTVAHMATFNSGMEHKTPAVVSCIVNFPDAKGSSYQIHKLLESDEDVSFRPLYGTPKFKVINARVVYYKTDGKEKEAIELTMEVPEKYLTVFYPKADPSIFNSPILSNL